MTDEPQEPVRQRTRRRAARNLVLDPGEPPFRPPQTYDLDALQEALGVGIEADFPFSPDAEIPVNRRSRMLQVSLHGARYTREYVFAELHRMLMRRVPIDIIARAFGVSVRNIYRWKAELKRRMALEAEHTDVRPLFTETKDFYEEIRALAMRIVATDGATTGEKVKAMNVALRATDNLHRFLEMSGFYARARIEPQAADDPQTQQADMLFAAFERIEEGVFEMVGEEGEGDDAPLPQLDDAD